MPGGKPLLACLFVFLSSPPGAAQAPGGDGIAKQAVAVRVSDGAIRLDGRLDDPGWLRAPVVADFVQKEPVEGAPPTERTEVRFAYDAHALYVAARMYSRDPSAIQAPMGRRDNVDTQSENIVVSFDTFLDRRTAYSFGVTASGVRLDRFHGEDDEASTEAGFDPVWEAKSSINEDGWTAEMWIPFSQLRFHNRPEQVWGLNVRRFIPTREEQIYWALVPRTERAWASRFGVLSGITDVVVSRRLELLPFIVGSSMDHGQPPPGDPFRNAMDVSGRGGLDMKMGLGPNLTLQATVNPDFGQVEANPAEVNLSAVPTRFAERRPFFVDDAELLNIDHPNFFYSRRIGARPAGPAAGDFVDYPAATTILGAAKLTGRIRSRTALGVLAAVTGGETARVAHVASPDIQDVRVAAPASYALARVQQEFGRLGSTVSVMAGGVHRALGAGNPLAAILPRRAVTVAGDVLLRFKGGEYEVRSAGGGTFVTGDALALQRIQLSSAHYAQRPDRTYSRYDPTLTSLPGYAWSLDVNRVSGRHWLFGLSTKLDSPGYDSNDIGFLMAADGIQPVAYVRYRETRPGRIFRAYAIELRQSNEWNYGWDLQSASTRPSVNVTWNNFWTSSWSVTFNKPSQSATLTRGGPLMGTPPGWSTAVSLGNSTTAQTRWSTTATVGTDEDGGRTNRITGTFSFRPGPRWQLGVTPLYERQIYTQQYIATGNGGRPETYDRRYIFANIDRTTVSTQYRLNFTLKPDLTLDVYTEPFAASGRYFDYGELRLPRTRDRLRYGSAGTIAISRPDGGLDIAVGDAPFTLPNRDFNVRSFRSTIVLRHEWRPGSTLYVVWQQDRRSEVPIGTRAGADDMFRSLADPGQSVFLAKIALWLPIR